jgi:hypothetical protein
LRPTFMPGKSTARHPQLLHPSAEEFKLHHQTGYRVKRVSS